MYRLGLTATKMVAAPLETTSFMHDAESGEVQQRTAATPSTAARRAAFVLTLAAVAVFAKGTAKTTDTRTSALSAEEIKAKLGNSWQCNQVCYSDSDCNSLTGPCIYCSSGSGSGSGGTCVDSEDDHGLHNDDGDNEPSASPTYKPTSTDPPTPKPTPTPSLPVPTPTAKPTSTSGPSATPTTGAPSPRPTAVPAPAPTPNPTDSPLISPRPTLTENTQPPTPSPVAVTKNPSTSLKSS
jgi:hypothetical protein